MIRFSWISSTFDGWKRTFGREVRNYVQSVNTLRLQRAILSETGERP